jgi:hypothetical protein
VPALVKAIKTSSGNRDALVSGAFSSTPLASRETNGRSYLHRPQGAPPYLHRRSSSCSSSPSNQVRTFLDLRLLELMRGPLDSSSASLRPSDLASSSRLSRSSSSTRRSRRPTPTRFPLPSLSTSLSTCNCLRSSRSSRRFPSSSCVDLGRLENHSWISARASFLSLTSEVGSDEYRVVSESSDRVTAAAKEQITNVAGFLALALEAKQLGGKIDAARASNTSNVDLTLSELVRGLLEISSLPLSASYTSSDKSDLEVLSGYSLQASVRLMSTSAFSEAVLWLLDIGDSAIEASALGLLRSRLPTIKAARRGDISPAVVNVIERLRASLTDEEALETLEVIASSVYPEEDSALAKTVPDLMVVASAASVPKSTRILAMDIIKKLS